LQAEASDLRQRLAGRMEERRDLGERQVRVGGEVRLCASWVVSRLTTSRGAPPYGASSASVWASSTGCRPAAWIPATTGPTVAGVAGSSTAVGVPHMPLTTWANRSAVSESRMTTEASGPIAAHSWLTAVSSPPPGPAASHRETRQGNDWKAVWTAGYTPAMTQMASLLLVTPH